MQENYHCARFLQFCLLNWRNVVFSWYLSFAIRSPRLFNCMTNKIHSSNTTFNSFKSQLDKFLSEVPDSPSMPNYPQSAVGNVLQNQLDQLRRAIYYIEIYVCWILYPMYSRILQFLSAQICKSSSWGEAVTSVRVHAKWRSITLPSLWMLFRSDVFSEIRFYITSPAF